MNCADYSDRMAAAALDDLSDAERARLEEHLAGCARCRAELARLAQALAASAPSEGFESRLRAAARAEIRAVRAGGRRRLAVLVAATAAAAAAVLLVLLPVSRPPPGEEAKKCSCWRFVDGDAGNSRHLDAELACVPERVLWEQKLRGRPGAFKPLAWKELLIVGLVEARRGRVEGGRLVALEVESGVERWSRSFENGDFLKAKGFPDRCVAEGRLYLTDGRRCLVLDAATGEDLAAYAPPEGAAGWAYLAAAGARLYGTAKDGGSVFCVDAATGRTVWSRRVAGRVYVPAIARGRLYLHTLAGEVAALDARTGADLWRREKVAPGRRSSVHVRGDRIVCLTDRDEVLAFDAADGRLAWRSTVSGAFASGLAMGDGAVYVSAGTVALSLEDGRFLWKQGGPSAAACSAPAVAGGLLVAAAAPRAGGAGLRPGSLGAFDAAGRLLGAVKDAALQACDGAVISGDRVFTVTGGRVLAMTCTPRG